MANNKLENSPLTNVLFNKASANKIPLSGTFELTPLCNFNCKMCYIKHSEKEIRCHKRKTRNLENWKKLAEDAEQEGMLYLLLTGGEPLLWKDFWKLYEYLGEKPIAVSVNSNGSLIDKHAVECFKKNPPRRINITLYGASDDTYKRLCRIEDGFQKVDRAIQLLLDAGILVKLNCSLTPYNMADLEAMVSYANEKKLILDVSPYMFPPIRKEKFEIGVNERFLPDEVAYWYLKSYQLRYEKQQYIEFLHTIKNEIELPEKIQEIDCKYPEGKLRCRAGNAAFWITWDGYMLPCGMMTNPKIDLNETGFKKAWETVVEKTESIRLAGKCDNCKSNNICHSCAAMAYAETGDVKKVPTYMCNMVMAMDKLINEQLKIYGAE